MAKKFDLIVIGGGSGLNVASLAARKGMKVAVIEPGPLGGTCLNRGCIPSKMLIESAEVGETIKRSSIFGIDSEIKGVDFPAIMRRTMEFVDEEAAGIEEAINANPNYTLYKYFARFTGPKKILVGKEEIEGDKILIAAGTSPFVPPIPGLDKTAYHTSDTIFRLEKQPEHVVFIGGGYISAELAHFFGGIGSEVTVLDRGELLVSNEDGEIARNFTEVFSRKYNVLMKANIAGVSGPEPGQEGEVTVSYTVGEGKETKSIKGDLLFVATGRAPATGSLQCKEAGYELSERGFLVVNEYLETSEEGVWALGDIVGKAPFKHGANYEARIIARNLFASGKDRIKADYSVMPHAIYSSPQVGGVGLTEEQAKEKGIDYAVGRYQYIKTGMGKALDDQDGFVKIIADRKSRRIIGAHILGTDSSILIHELIVAMAACGGEVSAIQDSIHIHPALSEVVQRAVNSISWDEAPEETGKTLMERTTEQRI